MDTTKVLSKEIATQMLEQGISNAKQQVRGAQNALFDAQTTAAGVAARRADMAATATELGLSEADTEAYVSQNEKQAASSILAAQFQSEQAKAAQAAAEKFKTDTLAQYDV